MVQASEVRVGHDAGIRETLIRAGITLLPDDG
jgi:hypothetical protein